MDILKILVLWVVLVPNVWGLDRGTCRQDGECSWTAGLLLQYTSGEHEVYKLKDSAEFWSKMTCDLNRIEQKHWTAQAIHQMQRQDVVNAKVVCVGVPQQSI